jgi:hypothetical protein
MSSSAEAACCIICLDSDPPPIQSGCACRSDTGLAHLDCLIEKAVSQQANRGDTVWWECQTCGQRFTGAMLTGLGEAWWSRVCDQAAESEDRLCAAHNLAGCRLRDGQYMEAERIQREVLGVKRRVLGEEHPSTLTSAADDRPPIWRRRSLTNGSTLTQSGSSGRCLALGGGYSERSIPTH